jgi:hypothetical protein
MGPYLVQSIKEPGRAELYKKKGAEVISSVQERHDKKHPEVGLVNIKRRDEYHSSIK